MFSSKTEMRLWLALLVVMSIIYSTLGLTPKLAFALRENGLLEISLYAVALILVALMLGLYALNFSSRGGWRGFVLGILAVFIFALARYLSPEERTHLVEYAVVGTLVFEALKERKRNGQRVFALPLLAIMVSVLLGGLDETIQWLLPKRVFDWRDVGFNGFAAIVAIGVNAAGDRVWRWHRQ